MLGSYGMEDASRRVGLSIAKMTLESLPLDSRGRGGIRTIYYTLPALLLQRDLPTLTDCFWRNPEQHNYEYLSARCHMPETLVILGSQYSADRLNLNRAISREM